MAKPAARRGARKTGRGEEGDNNLSSAAVTAVTVPDEVNIREVRTRIEDVFKALGTDDLPGTLIPFGQRNNSREAAEYVISDLLEKLATTRKKAASEAAEKAGVFGDPTTYVEGDTVMVFSDPNFSINVKMGRPSKMLGREEVELAASKYLGKKADEFLEECQKPRAATKQIIVSMK
jgi:hypothetical protein